MCLQKTGCGCADFGFWSCPGLRVMALAGIILTLAAGSEPVQDNEYGRRVVAQTLEDDYEALVWKARFGESLF